ncbi:hypothetical protein C8R43DRAFT_1076862 [Mycena crocata]|nr:hypothetical protein C8R43DRAFT_1076862 [Mycena crocata]
MSAKKSRSLSAKKADSETFDTREIVLGKMLGWQPWPGMVVDPATVPKAVRKERPANDNDAVYVVRFFPDGDYAWFPPKDLKRLTPGEIAAFIGEAGGRKTDTLMEAYRKALDPAAWEKEHTARMKCESKSKANKREDGNEEDELPLDAADDEAEKEAAGDGVVKVGRKRKRAGSDAPASGRAKSKTPKATGAKNGGKGGKGDATEEAEAKREEGGEEKRAAKKSKLAEWVSAFNSDPEAVRVLSWRHQLQKTFLNNKTAVPTEDEIRAVDALLSTVEEYQNMHVSYLTFSKIGKVMRHIYRLEPQKVPHDDKFKFRDRAKVLVDKWDQILNINNTGGDGEAASAAVPVSTTQMDLSGTTQ